MEQIHNEGSNHVIVKKICKIRFFTFILRTSFFSYTLSTVFHTTVKGTICHKKLANQYIFNSYNLQGVCARKIQGYVTFQLFFREMLHILVFFLHTYIGQGKYKDM